VAPAGAFSVLPASNEGIAVTAMKTVREIKTVRFIFISSDLLLGGIQDSKLRRIPKAVSSVFYQTFIRGSDLEEKARQLCYGALPQKSKIDSESSNRGDTEPRVVTSGPSRAGAQPEVMGFNSVGVSFTTTT
jgi:hypothetical protein